MPRDPITLSIIIVSWNVKGLLQKCIDSILENRGDLALEVVVVDNNSTDGTRETLQQIKDDHVRVILLDENTGFGKGNNTGLKQARGEYVLFLNPDTESVGDALANMTRYMETHPGVGAIGPKLLNIDGSIQRSVRRFPTLLSQLLVLAKLHNFIPQLPASRNYFQLSFDYSKEQDADQVMGAALMVRASVLEHVGGFDPGYRRIFEEVDLCYRIKKAGYSIRYIPGAEIIHHKGMSFTRQRIFRKQLDFNQGMLRFFKKHKPRWQYAVLALFQPVSWIVTAIQVLFAQIGDPVRRRFKKSEL